MMIKCDHEYWSPYPDLMLCYKCNDSFSKAKKHGIYAPIPKLTHIIDDNGAMQIFFDKNNKPKFIF
jgi:hypothetical protein